MESINGTLSSLMDMFQKRMTEFETQLQKKNTPSSPSSGDSNLAADFAAFRAFVTQALSSLQQQVELLARSLDNMEMRGRRGILLLHGVAEAKDEDTAQVVAQHLKNHMKMSGFTVGDIKRCHRMGRSSSSQKTRPILFKLRDVVVRDTIWFNKTKLKGSGVTLSEFLTKSRHDVFMAARKKFGVNRCWTRDGCVNVLRSDGTRQRVVSLSELNAMEQHDAAPAATATPEKPIVSRPKRAAANRK